MRTAAIVALQHHEKWDGSGYPSGLSGTSIDLFSRITALVDVFDALISKRVYRDGRNLKEVVEYLKSQRGLHFDPGLVDCFLANLADFVAIVKEHPDLTAENVLTKEARS